MARPRWLGRPDRPLRQQIAVTVEDLELVAFAMREARDEEFPDTRLRAKPHRIPPSIPGTEIADDRHPPRIRRPDRKAHAFHAFDLHRNGAERSAEIVMGALADQMQVEIAEQQREGIGIFHLLDGVRPVDPEEIGRRAAGHAGKQPAFMDGFQLGQHLAGLGLHHADRQCSGHQRPNHGQAAVLMASEDREWVSMMSFDQGCQALADGADHQVCALVSHETFSRSRDAIAEKPASGRGSQCGRLRTS